jgi:hypothetical protein
VSIEEVKKVLEDIQENPEILNEDDSEMEAVLKEIVQIERRHLYGLDSTSVSKRRNTIKEFLVERLKNKGC